MSATRADLAEAVGGLGLAGRPVLLHSSLSAHGHVDGGAAAIVDAFLDAGCTLVVPTFTWSHAVTAPPHLRPARNGMDAAFREDAGGFPLNVAFAAAGVRPVFDPATPDVDRSMGAVPAVVLARTGRIRGDHPLSSFTALGPRAGELVAGQSPRDVYAPVDAVAAAGGAVVLAGVGLTRMTLLHRAEELAGATLLRRWAWVGDEVAMVPVGGCSEGFVAFAASLASLERRARVATATWRVFDAAGALRAATEALRGDPGLAHCADPACARCDDLALGGPQLA